MSNANKGVREYQALVNYFLTLDRMRGATYPQLAKTYKLDQSNIWKRINERSSKSSKALQQSPIWN